MKTIPETQKRVIAYRHGEAGRIVHAACWIELDRHYREYTGRAAYIGTLYLDGAEKGGRELHGKKCAVCGQDFATYVGPGIQVANIFRQSSK